MIKANLLISLYLWLESLSVFLLFVIKQFLKLTFGIGASTSCLIAFIAATVISYLFERRFVFRKVVLSSTVKQLLLLIIRGAVNFGFYKLADFVFFDYLLMPKSFGWFIAIITSVIFNYFYDRTLLFDCDYDAKSVRKSRIYLAFYSNRYVFAAMSISMLLFGIIYIMYSQFPFGDNTVYRMDLYHQYGPLFCELYDRVTHFKSFFYSWTSGGGSSFLGNYFNYL